MSAGIVSLTGATGFIGSVLRERLVARGVKVRALARSRSGTAEDGTQWIRGTLEDEQALVELTSGADTVIHCAGKVRGSDARDFDAVNVLGSKRLMEAARLSGSCKRFLLISSLAARHPTLSWYAASKFEGERQVRAAAGAIPVCVFRPTAVYGPGDRELRPVFEWLLRGWLVTLGRNDSQFSFLHVEDLVGAVMQWLDAPVGQSQTFELCDGQAQGYDWASLASIASDIRNAPVRQAAVPAAVVKGIARANLMLSRLTRQAPMLTPGKVNELMHPDWTCSNAHISATLGWEPRILLRQALRNHLF
ncbi:NAD-dependent epimerase/dehydratase family protein [Pseudomonas putida]|uniref:NAD-dependent epimerase/dehydratase family protein n=1 Tax=Pseudomonas putida TaxID=303 RepID=UPI0015C30541|nr:NAD-dependent epimerase/dehydratase family protein [Pseudomonas putida]